jgi:4'-phosphopantetheinyl transferase
MLVLKDQIDIWLVEINRKNYHCALTLKCFLSDLETRKQNNFIFFKDQQIYLTSHIALRLILSKYLDIGPKFIEFQFNSYNKPYIRDCSELYFNLSHSGKLACIAVSTVEVGADIEYVSENFNYLEIVNNYFARKEVDLIDIQRDSANKSKMFFKIWTMKEALLKATGKGLTVDLPIINKQESYWQCTNPEYNIWQIKELELFYENYIASIAYPKGEILSVNYYNYTFNCTSQNLI